jgi:hypothetical protein
MKEQERAKELGDQAGGRGFLINYDSGFLVVTRPTRGERQQENAAEMGQVIIERLGRCMRELFELAVAKARGARGKDFLGRQVFLPALQIVGTLADCNSDGVVTVSCRGTNKQGRITNMKPTGRRGDDLLIIVDGDERSDLTSTAAYPGIASEKVSRLLERADSVGLCLEHDSGFVVAKWHAIGNVERDVAEATILQIGQSMNEVFAHLVTRARSVRGRDFVGHQVFVEEFGALGILESSGNDGRLRVTFHDKHLNSTRTCLCNGDGVLIIVDGDPKTTRAASDAPESKPALRNWLRRRFEA